MIVSLTFLTALAGALTVMFSTFVEERLEIARALRGERAVSGPRRTVVVRFTLLEVLRPAPEWRAAA